MWLESIHIMKRLDRLPTRDENGNLLVVVETPRDARAKFTYDPESGVFQLSRRLALGVAYPYDWGFIPSTLAPDGDPLDAMVCHDIATYPGVVIPCRAVGVVRITQARKDGARERNDRVIAVPIDAASIPTAREFDEPMRQELTRFFELAVLRTDKDVQLEGWGERDDAERLIQQACDALAAAK